MRFEIVRPKRGFANVVVFFSTDRVIERQACFKYHPVAPERKNGQRFLGMNILITGY
jgi:hypothetical protein